MVEDLAVGESKSITIEASEPVNRTYIRLLKGKKYKFTVSSPAWNNGVRVTDAGGYNDTGPYGNTRRHLDYKTMALVGEIYNTVSAFPTDYTGYKFLIGLGRDSFTAPVTGYLVAFANDCIPCYADNSRVVTLKVTRTS